MRVRFRNFKDTMRSREGRNVIVFTVFLLISAVLWIIMSLNEETQRDLRCTVVINNVPDSMTRITPLPEALNVSVRAKGTELIKYLWKKRPQMNIDYRQYKSGNKVQFSDASLKAFFRSMVGGGCQILSVTPDSLSILFTSQPGVKVPVRLDAHITPAPHYALVGKTGIFIDSVVVYSAEGNNFPIKSVSTIPLLLSDIRKSQIVRVPLALPKDTRAIPDSVEVSIEVEPLISKTRKVAVTTINVPEDLKLITVPQAIEIYYMVPMNIYKKSEGEPKFKVVADYNTIKDNPTERIAVSLAYAPRDFLNVFLSTDSVDYIIEQK